MNLRERNAMECLRFIAYESRKNYFLRSLCLRADDETKFLRLRRNEGHTFRSSEMSAENWLKIKSVRIEPRERLFDFFEFFSSLWNVLIKIREIKKIYIYI